MTLVSNLQLNTARSKIRLAELELQKENLIRNAISNIAISGTSLLMGTVCPELAIAVNILNMGLKGSAGLAGVDGLFDKSLYKLGIKEGNMIGAEVLNSILKFNSVMNQMDEETYQLLIKFIGMGATYKFSDSETEQIAFTGFYDPYLLKNMMILSDKGLASLVNWDTEETIKYIEELKGRVNVKSPEEKQELIELCEAIIRGEHPFVIETDGNGDGIPEYKLNIDLDYLNALRTIENVTGVDVRREYFVTPKEKDDN